MAVSIMDHIGSSGGDGMQHLKNGIKYILNPLKTGDRKYTGTVNCISCSPEEAFHDFIQTKKYFGKMMEKKSDRQGYHFVLSFSPEDDVNEEMAMKITEEFIEKYLGEDFESVYAVHNDRAHIHSHIIFNSVSVSDGRKYHDNKGDWERILQPIVNELCKRNNLQTIDLEKRATDRANGIYSKQKKYHKWEAERNNCLTWAEVIRRDIDEGILLTHDVDKLFEWLKTERGYEVKCGKHIAYRPYGKERFMRETQLGTAYLYHNIIKRIDDLNSGKTLKESLAPFENIPKLKGIVWEKRMSSYVWRSKEDFKKYVKELYRTGRIRVLRNSEQYNKEALARFYQVREELQYVNKHDFRTVEELSMRLKEVETAMTDSSISKETKSNLYREKKLLERSIKDFGEDGGKLSAEFQRKR